MSSCHRHWVIVLLFDETDFPFVRSGDTLRRLRCWLPTIGGTSGIGTTRAMIQLLELPLRQSAHKNHLSNRSQSRLSQGFAIRRSISSVLWHTRRAGLALSSALAAIGAIVFAARAANLVNLAGTPASLSALGCVEASRSNYCGRCVPALSVRWPARCCCLSIAQFGQRSALAQLVTHPNPPLSYPYPLYHHPPSTLYSLAADCCQTPSVPCVL